VATEKLPSRLGLPGSPRFVSREHQVQGFMKKSIFLTLLLWLLIAFSSHPEKAQAYSVFWQIGIPHGAVDPIEGAREFPATGSFSSVFDYSVGLDSDPINHPGIPGYMGLQNVGVIDPGRRETDTTARLNIHFELESSYLEQQLCLVYERYGSEKDLLYLEGVETANIEGTFEGCFQSFQIYLGAMAAGSHTIALGYNNGGRDNGHYLDCLALRGPEKTSPTPEPFSALLVSLGLVGIAVYKKTAARGSPKAEL
jgi:hypothetical protein